MPSSVLRICLFASSLLLVATPAAYAQVAVYGSPTWDAVTQTGLVGGDVRVAPGARANGSGVAIRYQQKYVSGNSQGNRAVLWDAATATAAELGTLGLSSSNQTFSRAYAVNDAGATVGSALKYAGQNI